MNNSKIKNITGGLPFQETVLEAKHVLESGGVIVYPTDTSYGIGVNALDHEVVSKLYEIKKRGRSKPMHIVVPELEKAKTYAEVTKEAEILSKAFLPGPLTLVLNKKPIVPSVTTAGLGSVGIRIPNHPFILELSKVVDFPITATSANISELGDVYAIEEILKQYGDEADKIDLFIDGGSLEGIKPSTLVDLTGTGWKIIREGPISGSQIQNALNEVSE